MEPSLYTYIWRHSRRDQIAVLLIVLASMPFYFLSLTLPKDIVNLISGATQSSDYVPPRFFHVELSLPNPVSDWLGMPWIVNEGFAWSAMATLMGLSCMFLALVVINGLFKMRINTLKGRMGERMLRRLRYDLVDRVLRFPVRHFRKIKPSEVASMVKDEVEPLGGFIGDAIVLPAFLSLQAATAMLFIMLQSFWLGLIALVIVAGQAVVVAIMRKPILQLGRQRQLQARELAGRVGEIVDGASDIHAHDTSNYERADISARLGRIFDIRFEIYQRKFFVKFINNFMSQLAPFIFYALGGYLALTGQMNVGQLVAVIVAYKDLPGPIKELLDWYQQLQDVTIKYEQVAEQFHPDGMLAPELQSPAGLVPPLAGPIELSAVSVADDSGFSVLDGISLQLGLSQAVALTGPSGGGKEAFAALLGRQVRPAAGALRLAGDDFFSLPEAVTGRRIGYASSEVYVLAASLRDNLLYSLKNEPRQPARRDPAASLAAQARLVETARSGNAVFDLESDWLGLDDLTPRLFDALYLSGLEADVFQWGLQSKIDARRETLAGPKLLEARATLRARLAEEGAQGLVESFDPLTYNRNASLAENILFGTSTDPAFALDALAVNPYVRRAIASAGLEDDLVGMGRSIADTMLELFRDFPPDHPFFDEFSFIPAGKLPAYESLLKRSRGALHDIAGADREKLLVLPFKYVDARHRLGLIDDRVKARIVESRNALAADLRAQGSRAVAFYEPLEYNFGASIQDNVLFGRVAYGIASAAERVNALIRDILSGETLEPVVLDNGLEFQAGAGGKRLSPGQRQKLGLARAVLKNPELLIVNGALNALDDRQRSDSVARILAGRKGKATIWVLPQEDIARQFERTIRFEHGRVVADGPSSAGSSRAAQDAAQ
jgi:putative ABC transport system ATP-binding protein